MLSNRLPTRAIANAGQQFCTVECETDQNFKIWLVDRFSYSSCNCCSVHDRTNETEAQVRGLKHHYIDWSYVVTIAICSCFFEPALAYWSSSSTAPVPASARSVTTGKSNAARSYWLEVWSSWFSQADADKCHDKLHLQSWVGGQFSIPAYPYPKTAVEDEPHRSLRDSPYRMIPHSLTIVNTPRGYSGSVILDADRQFTKNNPQFCRCSVRYPVTGIVFVAPPISNSLQFIFGESVKGNANLLITFADVPATHIGIHWIRNAVSDRLPSRPASSP